MLDMIVNGFVAYVKKHPEILEQLIEKLIHKLIQELEKV